MKKSSLKKQNQVCEEREREEGKKSQGKKKEAKAGVVAVRGALLVPVLLCALSARVIEVLCPLLALGRCVAIDVVRSVARWQ